MTAGGSGGDPTPALDPAPPDPDAWARVGDEDFAAVVAHARRALADLDDDAAPDAARLRAIPASRLVRGPGRRRLLGALAAGGPLWVAVRTRLGRDPDLVARLVASVTPPEPPTGEPAAVTEPEVVARIDQLRRARDDLRDQRDRARAERDEARRQREGAAGRETALRTELDEALAELDDLRARLARRDGELADADRARDQAVAREARRGDTRRRALEDELATTRRELDELRRERAADRGVAPTRTGRRDRVADRPVRTSRQPRPDWGSDRVRAGRPSRLPRGTRLDTRAGAEILVDAVGRLLVDGYNVTRTHRADLDLAEQRDWLVRGLEALAARRGVDVEVVFDAHRGGQPSGRRRGRVQVSYTHPGISADDEIVFGVEATDVDRPLVVVTDDRELRRRLAPARVDLLPTASLVWMLGGR